MKITTETPTQLTLDSKVLFGLLGATTYNFDKAAGKLTVNGKGLFGGKSREVSLSQITGVKVTEAARTGAERNDPAARMFRIEFVCPGGSNIPLTTSYSSGQKAKENLAEKLRQFLLS